MCFTTNSLKNKGKTDNINRHLKLPKRIKTINSDELQQNRWVFAILNPSPSDPPLLHSQLPRDRWFIDPSPTSQAMC
jgi:hypothetical protein